MLNFSPRTTLISPSLTVLSENPLKAAKTLSNEVDVLDENGVLHHRRLSVTILITVINRFRSSFQAKLSSPCPFCLFYTSNPFTRYSKEILFHIPFKPESKASSHQTRNSYLLGSFLHISIE